MCVMHWLVCHNVLQVFVILYTSLYVLCFAEVVVGLLVDRFDCMQAWLAGLLFVGCFICACSYLPGLHDACSCAQVRQPLRSASVCHYFQLGIGSPCITSLCCCVVIVFVVSAVAVAGISFQFLRFVAFPLFLCVYILCLFV